MYSKRLGGTRKTQNKEFANNQKEDYRNRNNQQPSKTLFNPKYSGRYKLLIRYVKMQANTKHKRYLDPRRLKPHIKTSRIE